MSGSNVPVKVPTSTRRKPPAVPSGHLISWFPKLYESAPVYFFVLFWSFLGTGDKPSRHNPPRSYVYSIYVLCNLHEYQWINFQPQKKLAMFSTCLWLDWVQNCNNFDRKEKQHPSTFASLPWTISCFSTSTTCQVTDFSEKMTVKRLTFCHLFSMFISSWQLHLSTTLWITRIRFC